MLHDEAGADNPYVPAKPEDLDYLLKLPWVAELMSEPGSRPAAAAMSEPAAINGVDPDHLFLSMLREGLVRDVMFLYNEEADAFHTLIATSCDVCGHSGIVHGGFTSAVLDETTGGLVYEMKKHGRLGPGPAFTARLEVDYKMPVPAGTTICCCAKVEKVEGRKIWTVAELRDYPGGQLFAQGRALYVTARQPAEAAASQRNLGAIAPFTHPHAAWGPT